MGPARLLADRKRNTGATGQQQREACQADPAAAQQEIETDKSEAGGRMGAREAPRRR
jgi:hypothetical protein